MRKKLMFLVLALTATAVSLPTRTAEANAVYCPQCQTYEDGSRCCTDCWCYPSGLTDCTMSLYCEGNV